MEKTFESRTLSIRIDRDAQDVYDFVSVPENWPKWATGLGTLKKGVHGSWIAETPQGQVKVRFTKQNDFGVLDHYVTPEGGAEIYIPMRIIANGKGSEVLFTLFHLPGVSDEKFKEDAEWVMRDLTALKKLLEAK
jgi:hypothetical protein